MGNALGEREEVKLILDTCALLWSVLSPDRLTPGAKSALTDTDAEVIISPISCAEIVCGVARGRISLDRHWRPWFRHFLDVNGWGVADIGLETIEEAYSLPEFPHNDPADRIIVATARIAGGAVVTADQRILSYPHVKTVW